MTIQEHDLLIRVHGIIIHGHDIIIRVHEIIIRLHDIIIHAHEIIIRLHNIIIRALDLIIRANGIRIHSLEIINRSHEIIIRFHDKIIWAHNLTQSPINMNWHCIYVYHAPYLNKYCLSQHEWLVHSSDSITKESNGHVSLTWVYAFLYKYLSDRNWQSPLLTYTSSSSTDHICLYYFCRRFCPNDFDF